MVNAAVRKRIRRVKAMWRIVAAGDPSDWDLSPGTGRVDPVDREAHRAGALMDRAARTRGR